MAGGAPMPRATPLWVAIRLGPEMKISQIDVQVEAPQSLKHVIWLEDNTMDNYSIAQSIDHLNSVNLFKNVFAIGFKLTNIAKQLFGLFYNINLLIDIISINNTLYNNNFQCIEISIKQDSKPNCGIINGNGNGGIETCKFPFVRNESIISSFNWWKKKSIKKC